MGVKYMSVSSLEMKQRAIKFIEDYKDSSSEKSEAQNYWRDFFNIFGVSLREVGIFEQKVKQLSGSDGFIDLFWSGQLIVEHKSLGKNLDSAFQQALGYAQMLSASEKPKYIIVSDFQRIRLINLIENIETEFKLGELVDNLSLFRFIHEKEIKHHGEQMELNLKASELMADLHDSLKETNYKGHQLEIFIIRILFCLYAEDTGIFNNYQFTDFVKRYGSDNPQDLGQKIQFLFRVLNQKETERQTINADDINDFPYVNGKLFEEQIIPPSFNQAIYNKLVRACYFDWSSISPSIFGSLFQYVIEPENRRNLGAHYTSESNILKVINTLFMDELWLEFEKSKRSNRKLRNLHEKIGELKFFDPACGCGNFLIVAYRELRLLEYEILKILKNDSEDNTRQTYFEAGLFTKIKISSFYGIEIEEFPSRIAQVAMWFIEHQMNLMYETLDIHKDNLPLKSSLNIHNKNALELDWGEILPPNDNVYVFGNPPFVGKQEQSDKQKEEMKEVFKGFKKVGSLDYVAAWYKKACEYIENTGIEVAFVSTNSICQGEQVAILWQQLKQRHDIKINFAHQTFKWSNEAKNNAGVYVVIVGFSLNDRKEKIIFTYGKPNSEIPNYSIAEKINSYLVEGEEVFVKSMRKPLCDVDKMFLGSIPRDGGNLILSPDEKEKLIKNESLSEKYIRPLIGARQYLNNEKRYCLWLEDVLPSELQKMPLVLNRVNDVKAFRLESPREQTRNLAKYPTLFAEIRQPKTDYILVPLTTSENRDYVPIGFMDKDIIVNNSVSVIESDDLLLFAVLTSKMHMTWMRYVCGRLESRYRYSASIVYNNFPFPEKISEQLSDKIIKTSENLLEIREKYSSERLADLYNPILMPNDLRKCHEQLDNLIDKTYRNKKFIDDNDRMNFLFKKYSELIK